MFRFTLLLLLFSNFVYAKPIIFSSLEPISFLIKEIAKTEFQVETLIPAGKNPHTFTPTPTNITKLSQAKIYFLIDAPFEQVIKKRLDALENLKVIDLATNLPRRPKTSGHHHHNNHEHHHKSTKKEASYDPHIWLGPIKIKKMAQTIKETLSKFAPKKEKMFAANLKAFNEKHSLITNKIKKQLAPFKGRTVLVVHPAFGHFLDYYGLHQATVERNDKIPTIKHLKHIIEHAKEDNIKILFSQPQYDPKMAQAIANGIGGKMEIINALEPNILENFIKMANTIERALK